MQALDKAGAYRTDLLIDAMIQFEHEPAMRSVLASANAKIQCTAIKNRCNKTEKLFLRIFPS
jgi:hypothetical protein